jgi:putative DNA primase/helicase
VNDSTEPAKPPGRRKVIPIIIGQRQKNASGRGEDWRDQLARSGEGYAGDERNVLIAMCAAEELRGLVRYDEFSMEIRFTRSPCWREAPAGSLWLERDDTLATAWLQAKGLKLRGTGVVSKCINVIAQESPVHPVREYLTGLQWDECPRLDGWLEKYLGAEGPGAYLAAVGRRFLISAVARIMKPGCQADHVLVLEGPQGGGKTSTARALSVRPEWFAGSLPDVGSKDAALQLCGRWIVEVAELRAIRASQQEAVKSFLTQVTDTFRAPYAARTQQVPRQCVFIGTTNESEYLRDRTGNRRFWPVRCVDIDLEALTQDRDQLYAEAMHALERGEPWHLDGEAARLAQAEQADRVAVSETEATIARYLEQLKAETVTVRDVLVHALGLDPAESAYAERARRLGPEAAEAILRCGWAKHGRGTTRGVKETIYRRSGQGGQGK